MVSRSKLRMDAAADEQGRRSEFALRYVPLVRRLARRLRWRVRTLEIDELVSAGTIGLMEAIDRFDPERGVSLAHFARRRIKGAMIDALRRERRASSTLSVPGFRDVSFEEPCGNDTDLRLGDVVANPASPAPVVHAELNELLEAVGRLPRRERAILRLHIGGYSGNEIAARFGCSASRASQLLAQAQLRVREATGW